ncbi:hypothetical protein [Paraburkholderia bannensis]|uniref:hypothetical protein n=1 Tax=Paraburkholderia bannensis TaxID=765414 RepID=UPI002AB6A7EA|nr:hypothetical protein [Paraburkholderia bannensis]
MTDREVFDAWFDGVYDRRAVAESLIAVGFYFWLAGRESLIAASGAAVELRTLPEPQ